MGCCGKARNIALGWYRLTSGFTAPWAVERQEKCEECDEQSKGGFCKICWCLVKAKVLVESEYCKLGKWTAISPLPPKPPKPQSGTEFIIPE